MCTLCCTEKGTLHHILNNCKVALEQGRFTWRHDQVLSVLVNHIKIKINNPTKNCTEPFIAFVPAGTVGKITQRKKVHSGILDNAEDWSLMVDDIDDMMVFPGFIAETNLRPDIVIWSRAMQQVIIIELTVPAETNFENANYRKKSKYSDLVDQCQINRWKVHLFPIEIGSRGFVYGSLYKCLRELGMHNKTLKIIVREMSKMAVRCSYAIYLSRKKFDFEK